MPKFTVVITLYVVDTMYNVVLWRYPIKYNYPIIPFVINTFFEKPSLLILIGSLLFLLLLLLVVVVVVVEVVVEVVVLVVVVVVVVVVVPPLKYLK